MSLPTLQDRSDEHDDTEQYINAVVFFSFSPDQRLTQWRADLLAANAWLQLAFMRYPSTPGSPLHVDDVDLSRYIQLFHDFDQIFFPASPYASLDIVWVPDLMNNGQSIRGCTGRPSEGSILIELNSTTPYDWEEMLGTILHEFVHAWIMKQACRGRCQGQACRRVWRTMDGQSGHSYYFQHLAYAVERFVEGFLGRRIDLARLGGLLEEVQETGTIPSQESLSNFFPGLRTTDPRFATALSRRQEASL